MRKIISPMIFSLECQVIEIEQTLNNGSDEFLKAVNSFFMWHLFLMNNKHQWFIKRKACPSRLLPLPPPNIGFQN